VSEKMREIQLPAALCETLEQRFGANFRNLEELLTFALQELVRDDGHQMDKVEQGIIEERLKDLGYI
jgi:hypothetical protein